jgi:uroporphyrinogen III methyltransferase / synthase
MIHGGRSLAERRILLTRRPDQSEPLARRLADLGATVVFAPAIEVGAPEDQGPLDEALRDLDQYEWLVFTSPNAVAAVKARLEALGQYGLPTGLKVASVGRTTSEAAMEAFRECPVALAPADDYRAEGLVEAFAKLDLPPRRVLLPVSDLSRPTLAEGLRALGATVDQRVAYRTSTPEDLASRLQQTLASGIDLVLFASPSAVQGFVDVLGAGAAGLPAVAIGPTTAASARLAGMQILAVADPSTVEGLVVASIRALEPDDLCP